MFFSFILCYYMFSKLTPSLFVFAGLASRLRNCSFIGYESWSQVHAFHEDLSCVVYFFGEKYRSDNDTGKKDLLTYLVLYKITIIYDAKESIFKSQRIDVNFIIISNEVKSELCLL